MFCFIVISIFSLCHVCRCLCICPYQDTAVLSIIADIEEAVVVLVMQIDGS
jgi:hypothetical protein